MQVQRALWLVVFLVTISSCAPAVPYNEMPGFGDPYSQAQNNRALAEQLLRQAEMAEQAMTASAQAPIIRMTETAAAVIVEQAHAQATTTAGAATQAAGWTATAALWTPTPNLTATLDAIAISAAGTQTTLNLQREENINDFKGMLPAYSFVIVVLVLAIFLMLVVRRNRFQFAKVDARGNMLPVLDVVDGQFTDMDRSPNFKGSMKNDWMIRLLAHWFEKKTGAKLMLPEVTAGRQDAVTFRDQMMDLAVRGLPAPTAREDARKAKVGEMMTQPQLTGPKVQVIAPDLVRPILLDVVPQIAQDSIEAELYEPQKDEGGV